MKIFYLFLLILHFSFVPANETDPIDKTATLLGQGAIHELSNDFASTVQLTIMNEEDIYTKTEAEAALSNFFKRNQPKSVKILHRICSNPNFRFGVIFITTTNGVFRTGFSLKNIKGHFELNELRIEAQKTK